MEQTDETPKWERDTRAYRGLVLMRACNIVRHRLKLATWNEMAALLAVSAKSLTTYRSGKPIGQMRYACAMFSLEELVEEWENRNGLALS